MRSDKIYQKAGMILLLLSLTVSFAFDMPKQTFAAETEKSFSRMGTSTVLVQESGTQYIKFKAGVTGYVTVKIAGLSNETGAFAEARITFCDGNKNALGQKNEFLTTNAQVAERYRVALLKYNINFKKSNCYARTYGVRKDTTYYFAVKTKDPIKVTAVVKSVSKGKNTTLKTAQSISKNKKTESVIIAGDKKADWYQLKLKKAGKIQLDYTAKTNGSIVLPDNKSGIRISFYNADGTLFYVNGNNKSEDYLSSVVSQSWCRFYRVNSSGSKINLAAGTYYIKVERLTKKSSGQYTLKWSTY